MASSLADLVAAESAKPWFHWTSDELRRLYDVRREGKRCAQAGLSIGLLAIFYMSCFGLDLLFVPDVWRLSVATRLLVTPIIGGIAFAYSRIGPGYLVEARNAIAIIIATSMWSLQMFATSNHLGVQSYLLLSPMLVIAANIFCNLSLKVAALTSSIIIGMMSFVLIARTNIEQYFAVGVIFQLSWMAILTLFINWRSDRESIRLFLLQLTSELQQETIEKSNVELLRLSSIDALTGVNNRRSADIALKTCWRDWTVDGEPFALALIDVDFFKSYNDGYGHFAGDQCLIAVANAMADVVATHGGFIGRFGGEEFIVLIGFKSVDSVASMAAAIRLAVRHAQIEHRHRGDMIDIVTISGGIALCADAAKPESLVEAADIALYQAKDTGRDRICLFEVASPGVALPTIEDDLAEAVVRLRQIAAVGKRAVARQA